MKKKGENSAMGLNLLSRSEMRMLHTLKDGLRDQWMRSLSHQHRDELEAQIGNVQRELERHNETRMKGAITAR